MNMSYKQCIVYMIQTYYYSILIMGKWYTNTNDSIIIDTVVFVERNSQDANIIELHYVLIFRRM